MFAQTLAPSAVPVKIGDGLIERIVASLVWSQPKEMTNADIERVIRQFVDTARLMADAGFSGVQLHGAHGYLIGMFSPLVLALILALVPGLVIGFCMSIWLTLFRSIPQQQGMAQPPPKPFNVISKGPPQTNKPQTNLRTDAYGGTPAKRAKFVLDILTETRKVVPATFCIGIKLNSADHSSKTFEETMTQIALLAEAGIDFMEISGGTYEDPKMMGHAKTDAETTELPKSARTAAREAFFLEFSKEVRKRHPDLVLMLTGGFRTRAGAESAILDEACDLVGIGRPAAVDPKFPLLLLDESVAEGNAGMQLNKAPIPWYTRFLPLHLAGAGAESVSFLFPFVFLWI
jgi:2,4-dienoyl-CoA reductase-like NADH-dependent reductase (Old Yellow Enzyme family)